MSINSHASNQSRKTEEPDAAAQIQDPVLTSPTKLCISLILMRSYKSPPAHKYIMPMAHRCLPKGELTLSIKLMQSESPRKLVHTL